MHAPLKIVMAAVVMIAGCASVPLTPRRFTGIPDVAEVECGIIRAALLSIVNKEPYYSKATQPPTVSYLAVDSFYIPDAFEDIPELAGLNHRINQTPVNIAGCVGSALDGPRGRTMGFKYPRELPTGRIPHPRETQESWVSRPNFNSAGDQAIVYLNRGACYRTTTIELVSPPSGAWRAISVRHNREEIVWSGRHPCDSWL